MNTVLVIHLAGKAGGVFRFLQLLAQHKGEMTLKELTEHGKHSSYHNSGA